MIISCMKEARDIGGSLPILLAVERNIIIAHMRKNCIYLYDLPRMMEPACCQSGK